MSENEPKVIVIDRELWEMLESAVKSIGEASVHAVVSKVAKSIAPKLPPIPEGSHIGCCGKNERHGHAHPVEKCPCVRCHEWRMENT